MANYLDANPNAASIVNEHSQTGAMVPIASEGRLFCLADRDRMDVFMPDTPLTVADFVVGLELLGFRFATPDGPDNLSSRLQDPTALPPSWDSHSLRLMTAFGFGRTDEIRAFIQSRDGTP